MRSVASIGIECLDPLTVTSERLKLRLLASGETGLPLTVGPGGELIGKAPEVRPDWVRFDLMLAAEVIGEVGLLFEQDAPAEIGYRVVAEHRRQGYATEALRVLVDLAFHAFDQPSLEAETAEDNVGSQRTLAKLGFASAGTCGERWSERRQRYVMYHRFRFPRPV